MLNNQSNAMKMFSDHSQDADDDRIMALKRFSWPISLNGVAAVERCYHADH